MVSKRQSRLEGHRRKFMAVIDNTPECGRAVRYAGMRARNSGGGLVLLYVISDADFNQWIGVGEIMRAEAREEAETVMAKIAQEVRETIGTEPELAIREGKGADEIMKLIEEDRDIAILVLAASSGKDGPGTARFHGGQSRCVFPHSGDDRSRKPHRRGNRSPQLRPFGAMWKRRIFIHFPLGPCLMTIKCLFF